MCILIRLHILTSYLPLIFVTKATFEVNLKPIVMNIKYVTFVDELGVTCRVNPHYITYIKDHKDFIEAFIEDETKTFSSDITYKEYLKLLND